MSVSGGAARSAADDTVHALFASSHDGVEDDRRERRAIARAAAGDRDGLQYLYERHAWGVYRHVRRHLRDDHEAEDVTQLVFLKLMSDIGRYDARRGRFSSWLLCVARNVAIDHLRKARPILSGETEHGGPVDEAGRDRRGALVEALSDLSDDQRKVIVLRQLYGLSPAEIAEKMDRTEGSVHALHHRARVATRSNLVRLNAAPSIHRRGRHPAVAAHAAIEQPAAA